ncbi:MULTISPECIES: hypothetical protein [unclassified Roseovarius]|uniref:hypothetical protein n=1 Tax=unclassified Roseovarius TaxID=2614913 RepID=UPI00274008F2|nr:hypothetical protein [Roseovarius sp. MMSF_3350]
MYLSERLDELRQVVPSCTLASFGDISTGLALRTSASDLYKQEYLDEVMRQASANFELSDLMSNDNDLVVLATPDEIRIFVRYQAGSPDIVCCVCGDVSDVPLATRSAQKILTEMAGAM